MLESIEVISLVLIIWLVIVIEVLLALLLLPRCFTWVKAEYRYRLPNEEYRQDLKKWWADRRTDLVSPVLYGCLGPIGSVGVMAKIEDSVLSSSLIPSGSDMGVVLFGSVAVVAAYLALLMYHRYSTRRSFNKAHDDWLRRYAKAKLRSVETAHESLP